MLLLGARSTSPINLTVNKYSDDGNRVQLVEVEF